MKLITKKSGLIGLLAIGGIAISVLFQNCSPQKLIVASKSNLMGSQSLSSLSGSSLQNFDSSDAEGQKYAWRTVQCNTVGCFAYEVGGKGTFNFISPPQDACDSSSSGQIVTVTMIDAAKNVSKKYNLICSNSNASTSTEVGNVNSATNLAQYQANLGSATSARINSGGTNQSTTNTSNNNTAVTTPSPSTAPIAAFGPGPSVVSSPKPGFRWATDFCSPVGCMLMQIGGQGTFSHIAPPDAPCSQSNANQIVTVTMKNPNNGTTKDFKVMCTDQNGSGSTFQPAITGASTANYAAITGAANSSITAVGSLINGTGTTQSNNGKCKMGTFANGSGGSTEWACDCPGDFSNWAKQNDGCYHRNVTPTPLPSVTFTTGETAPTNSCKQGEFKNDRGGYTLWACDCSGDFSTWVAQGNNCFHKLK